MVVNHSPEKENRAPQKDAVHLRGDERGLFLRVGRLIYWEKSNKILRKRPLEVCKSNQKAGEAYQRKRG